MTQNNINQPAHLVEMVNYEKDSVVSRTIVEKNTGIVTLFAFTEGQGLSEHTVPFDALVYLFDGEAEFTVSGKSFRVKSGDLFLIPAHHPHTVKTLKNFKMMLTMIRS